MPFFINDKWTHGCRCRQALKFLLKQIMARNMKPKVTSGEFPYNKSVLFNRNHCFFHFRDNLDLFINHPFSSFGRISSSHRLLDTDLFVKLFVRLSVVSEDAIFVCINGMLHYFYESKPEHLGARYGNKTFRPQDVSPLVVSPLVVSPLFSTLVVSPPIP